MGWLTPLYLAGLAALALPLLLHLIRRTPRGRQAFSSLMFLSPSPPRLTRRSRIDHWLLLLLRLAALALLATAFARPFVRESALLPLGDVPSRRVALLLDTSASMRRGDLWKQAQTITDDALADLGPNDDVALFTFDDRLKTLVEFGSSPGLAPAAKNELVRSELSKLGPGWGSTDLGSALVAVAGELERADDTAPPIAEAHVVLVSDLQRGAKTDALQSYDWPRQVRVQVHALSLHPPGNASVQILADESGSGADAPRVRVTNAADSLADQFTLRWTDGAQSPTDETTAIYIPPGQSRVVRVPRPETPVADRVVLAGDVAEFDNVFSMLPPRQQQVMLVYLGRDAADDPHGLQYYLRLALADDRVRTVEISSPDDAQPLAAPGERPPQLVIVARPVTDSRREQLSQYLHSGGTLLAVLVDRETADSLRTLWDDVQLADSPSDGGQPAHGDESAGSSQYQLLGEIDFTHPLFVQFADPRYGDFTKIHFWRRQAVRLLERATTRAIARFDNGDPAIMEREIGKGRAFVFASGWRPDDSQLALSSKFVPLMQAVADQACGPPVETVGLVVHQAAALPLLPRAAQPAVVEKPDGSRVDLGSGSEWFDQTDQPGIYRVLNRADEFRFAVNVSPAECMTEPIELERLEQLGVIFGDRLTRSQRAEQVRQQRDVELEGRQKVWRWLIGAVLVALVTETWLAGRRG